MRYIFVVCDVDLKIILCYHCIVINQVRRTRRASKCDNQSSLTLIFTASHAKILERNFSTSVENMKYILSFEINLKEMLLQKYEMHCHIICLSCVKIGDRL